MDDLLEKIIAQEREKVAEWMIANGWATGHGDTTEDLLHELKWQIDRRVRNAAEWQPIETAPQDIPLLLIDGSAGCCPHTIGQYLSSTGKWYLDDGEDGLEELTHWMYLPTPPR